MDDPDVRSQSARGKGLSGNRAPAATHRFLSSVCANQRKPGFKLTARIDALSPLPHVEAGMNTAALRAQQHPRISSPAGISSFYLIFFAGGMPALIYQVVWQRVLDALLRRRHLLDEHHRRHVHDGSGVGSLLGGRLADRVQNRGPYYAGLEALMGCIGFASIPAFSFVGQSLAGAPLATVVLVDFVLLLLPTTLMGMTLPIMCRIVIGKRRDDWPPFVLALRREHLWRRNRSRCCQRTWWSVSSGWTERPILPRR